MDADALHDPAVLAPVGGTCGKRVVAWVVDWAVRPGADISGLWEDVAVTDHHRASHNRSYWWQTGGSHAQVWAGEGLPSGHVLAWFLRGYAENG